jgi:hypothetical protein
MISVIYKRLIQVGKITGAVSFFFAAPYALAQYLQTKDAAQVEQTLNLFKQYNSPPFMGYREKVSKELIKNKSKISEAAKDEKQFEMVQLQIVHDGDIETELLLLFDFFDSVTVCVINQICDNNTAIQLFKPRALDIYLNFYQYMLLQRTTSATLDFGSGLEAIAKSGKPKSTAPTPVTTSDQAANPGWSAFFPF